MYLATPCSHLTLTVIFDWLTVNYAFPTPTKNNIFLAVFSLLTIIPSSAPQLNQRWPPCCYASLLRPVGSFFFPRTLSPLSISQRALSDPRIPHLSIGVVRCLGAYGSALCIRKFGTSGLLVYFWTPTRCDSLF